MRRTIWSLLPKTSGWRSCDRCILHPSNRCSRATPISFPHFHFSQPLERGLLSSEPGASAVLTSIDGATSEPARTQRILVLSGLPPLHANAGASIRSGGHDDRIACLRHPLSTGCDESPSGRLYCNCILKPRCAPAIRRFTPRGRRRRVSRPAGSTLPFVPPGGFASRKIAPLEHTGSFTAAVRANFVVGDEPGECELEEEGRNSRQSPHRRTSHECSAS